VAPVCLTAENQVALRDCNIVSHIMMFLSEQNYQELHVFAVMLLANCVDNADIVKVIVTRFFDCLLYEHLQIIIIDLPFCSGPHCGWASASHLVRN